MKNDCKTLTIIADGSEAPADFDKMICEMESMGAHIKRTLRIRRADVERMNLAPYLSALQSILRDRDSIIRRRQDVRPVICGYDSDPRKLFCRIPEVREFLSRLDQAFPHWCYFVDPKGDFLATLMACLCPLEGVFSSCNPNESLVGLDPADVQGFVSRHLGAMNSLIDMHGLDDEDGTLRKRMTSEVMKSLHL